jgi:hypothetical protein
VLVCLAVLSLMLFVDLQKLQATAENTWQTLQSLPEPFSGVAVTVGEKIYIFSSSNYTNHLFVYDTQSQTLTQTASMPTYRSGFGVAIVDHKIYTIGGQGAPGQGPSKVNEVFDTRTGTWETKQPAIDYNSELLANTINGRIYAMYSGGRYDGSNMTGTGSNIDVYYPETDMWTRKSALPQEVLGPQYSCVIDDKIYIIIDNTTATTLGEGKLHIYDTTADTWSTGATLPTYYKQSCMVATTGEHAPKQIYLVGGAIFPHSAILKLLMQLLAMIQCLILGAGQPICLPPVKALRLRLSLIKSMH